MDLFNSISHEGIARLVAGVYFLVLGAYVFTWKAVGKAHDRIDRLHDNHMAHLEERIAVLERHKDERDESGEHHRSV